VKDKQYCEQPYSTDCFLDSKTHIKVLSLSEKKIKKAITHCRTTVGY